MQLWMGKAVGCTKPPTLETCSASAQYLIGINAKYNGACHDSQTGPWL